MIADPKFHIAGSPMPDLGNITRKGRGIFDLGELQLNPYSKTAPLDLVSAARRIRLSFF